MVAGLSHDEFWELAPKEAYLSIKAAKAREDAHYSQMAVFVSVLANVAGSGPKKAIKPEQLYSAQLKPTDPTKPGSLRETPKDRRVRESAERAQVARIPDLVNDPPSVETQ